MKLIAEKKTARDKLDELLFVRRDGSTTRCQLPRQGTLPHDLIHYVVESRLPFRNGFLGLIAAGADAAFVLKVVHDKQNPQVETEAVQVESIVEALQTQLWAGGFDRDSCIIPLRNEFKKSPEVAETLDALGQLDELLSFIKFSERELNILSL